MAKTYVTEADLAAYEQKQKSDAAAKPPAGGFKEYEHLRGSDGQFIKMNGDVDVQQPDGSVKRGTVLEFTPQGPRVQYQDGSYEIISDPTKRLSAPPKPKARLRTMSLSARTAEPLADTPEEAAAWNKNKNSILKNKASVDPECAKVAAQIVKTGTYPEGGAPCLGDEESDTVALLKDMHTRGTANLPKASKTLSPADIALSVVVADMLKLPLNARSRTKPKAPKKSTKKAPPPKAPPGSSSAPPTLAPTSVSAVRRPGIGAQFASAGVSLPIDTLDYEDPLTAAVWQEWLHPRDRHGRFIKKGSVVDIDKVKRAKVIDLTREGPEVKYDKTGTTEVIDDLDRIEVAPEAVAQLDSKPDAPLPKQDRQSWLNYSTAEELQRRANLAADPTAPKFMGDPLWDQSSIGTYPYVQDIIGKPVETTRLSPDEQLISSQTHVRFDSWSFRREQSAEERDKSMPMVMRTPDGLVVIDGHNRLFSDRLHGHSTLVRMYDWEKNLSPKKQAEYIEDYGWEKSTQ